MARDKGPRWNIGYVRALRPGKRCAWAEPTWVSNLPDAVVSGPALPVGGREVFEIDGVPKSESGHVTYANIVDVPAEIWISSAVLMKCDPNCLSGISP